MAAGSGNAGPAFCFMPTTKKRTANPIQPKSLIENWVRSVTFVEVFLHLDADPACRDQRPNWLHQRNRPWLEGKCRQFWRRG